jgi:hypothetical protein
MGKRNNGTKEKQPNNVDRLKTIELAQRRARVVEMYFQGKYQHEIATDLGVTVRTIARDLKAMEEEWLESAVTDFARLRMAEKHRIDNLERTYWKAWKRSLRDKEETTSARTTGKEGDTTRAEVKRRGSDGNPAYLEGVRWCVDRRCKLFGLDKMASGDGAGAGVMILNGVDLEVALGLKPHPVPLLSAMGDEEGGVEGGVEGVEEGGGEEEVPDGDDVHDATAGATRKG